MTGASTVGSKRSNVTKFYAADAAKNPDAVLEQAAGAYESVLILGYDKNGVLEVRSSTNLDHAGLNWLIDTFKRKMLNGDYSE